MRRLPVTGGGGVSYCVFCKIIAGQIPSTRVHEDEHTLAFMDIGQVNPGHVLVAVKPHAENILALDDVLAGAVFRATARVARAVQAAFSPQGISIYQANGAAAGQTVAHLHVHVIPRWDADGMALTWPVKNPPRDALEAYAAKIRAAI